MTDHCAGCKNADLFKDDHYCGRCYQHLYSRIESLQLDIAFLKKMAEKDQETIKAKDKEIAELRQANLFGGDAK